MCNTRNTFHFLIVLAIGFELLNETSTKENEKAKYVVDSPNCRIPDYDPYDKSIDGIPSKWPPVECTSLPPLTTVTGNYFRRRKKKNQAHFSHVLHLHKHNFQYYNISQDNFMCCYKLVKRDDSNQTWPDDGYKLSKCISFTGHVKFHRGQEFIWVQCDEQGAENQSRPEPAPYVNMHAFIGYKEKAIKKIRTQDLAEGNMSIMIIGFDSISRLNLMRTMPKTVEYLRENGWYDLKGFNKVGDNTFPNLMAAFAGMNLDQVFTSCLPSQYTPLDDCPIIWKKFSDRGYVTAYGEDQPIISSFNSIKSGFKTTPTDYYMRPFILAAHSNTKLKEIGPIFRNQHRIACYGPTKVADHFFSYSLDFSRSFSGFSTFSLFWQNGFSHEHLNGPSTMDDTVLTYFNELANSGVLKRTMILFMSDHGFRFGPIRQTFLGYLEERLPFLYFWVPERLKKAHPNKINNLAINCNRLTSPYDVYMTLVDVLGENVTAPGCPKCRSLFELVPWDRSCADAGIMDHWCTCAEYSVIDVNSPLAGRMADMVVEAINNLMLSYRGFIEMGTACALLQLNTVVSIRKKISSSELDIPQVIVVVETYPGLGQFEGTVTYLGSWKVVDDISRINRYDNQSICASHDVLRKYCFCLYNW